jgi:hypothetical protein
MKEKDIYKLQLHDMITAPEFTILRVPGGWIYRFWDFVTKELSPVGVFVPFDDEFQEVMS